MATATITFTDVDGGVEISLDFSPAIGAHNQNEEAPQSALFALRALARLQEND